MICMAIVMLLTIAEKEKSVSLKVILIIVRLLGGECCVTESAAVRESAAVGRERRVGVLQTERYKHRILWSE